MLEEQDERDRPHSWLPLAVVIVIAAMFAVFMVRSYLVDSKADHLCRAIATIVSEGDITLDGIDYYQQPEHFEELANAHQANDRLLDLIACQPLPRRKENP